MRQSKIKVTRKVINTDFTKRSTNTDSIIFEGTRFVEYANPPSLPFERNYSETQAVCICYFLIDDVWVEEGDIITIEGLTGKLETGLINKITPYTHYVANRKYEAQITLNR